MLLQAILGAVELAAARAGMAGRAHKVPALDVVLHAVLALDDLGAEEAAPALLAVHLDHALVRLWNSGRCS